MRVLLILLCLSGVACICQGSDKIQSEEWEIGFQRTVLVDITRNNKLVAENDELQKLLEQHVMIVLSDRYILDKQGKIRYLDSKKPRVSMLFLPFWPPKFKNNLKVYVVDTVLVQNANMNEAKLITIRFDFPGVELGKDGILGRVDLQWSQMYLVEVGGKLTNWGQTY